LPVEARAGARAGAGLGAGSLGASFKVALSSLSSLGAFLDVLGIEVLSVSRIRSTCSIFLGAAELAEPAELVEATGGKRKSIP
jgi:hypothetical protein